MALELPAAETPDPVTSPSPTNSPEPSSRTLRVLVVDDNADLREILVISLDQDYQVESAASVAEALALVAGGHVYDVVLCDLMMPSGGAEQWLERCAALDPRLPEHTVLITGGATTEAAKALIDAHRGKVLYKPIEMQALRAMIARVA
jgi:DNA-binding NtrC family response regulator